MLLLLFLLLLEGELVVVVLEGERVVLEWSWWGRLDRRSCLHPFLEDLEGWLGWRVVSWEVGSGSWWRWRWRPDGGGLDHYLVVDLRWEWRRRRGVLDGNVGGVVVDDHVLGGVLASWGAP